MSKIGKIILLLIIVMPCLIACGPKPYYKTAEGKKKWKHYNSIQYDREVHKAPKRRN